MPSLHACRYRTLRRDFSTLTISMAGEVSRTAPFPISSFDNLEGEDQSQLDFKGSLVNRGTSDITGYTQDAHIVLRHSVCRQPTIGCFLDTIGLSLQDLRGNRSKAATNLTLYL